MYQFNTSAGRNEKYSGFGFGEAYTQDLAVFIKMEYNCLESR